MRLLGISLCVLALAASAALAQVTVLEDFEDGNAFSAGTVVADPEDAGNNCLYLVDRVVATLDLAAPLTAGESISIRVYDMGKSAMDDPETGLPAENSGPAGTLWGWNVGVSGVYNWGIMNYQKHYTNANAGYVWTGQYYDNWLQQGYDNHSMDWFGGPRQCDALSIIGTGTVHDPEIAGDGAWSTWIYTLNADGSVTLAIDGVRSKTSATGLETYITQVYVGNFESSLGEVYIDDVTKIGGGGVCNPGDADGDLDVDLDDFAILKVNFGMTEGADCSMGDFDEDGDVDLDDFALLKLNFGTTY